MANRPKPYLYRYILKGSAPYSITYILRSNFKSSIRNGLCKYRWTTQWAQGSIWSRVLVRNIPRPCDWSYGLTMYVLGFLGFHCARNEAYSDGSNQVLGKNL